jgi:hypothetical protein
MASINFIGKLRKLKENGYEEQEFSGGLIRKKVRCQMICGDSVQWLEATALVWKDEKKNKIYTIKSVENGKDEKVEVKWSDRFNESVVSSIAGYKKWVIDTDTFSHRKELEEGGLDDELEKSKKKRKEFLHAADFIDYLVKVLDNEKSKDMVFRVTGSVDFSYSENKGQYYRTFTPQKITRVPDDTKQICEGSMKVYFSENAVDDTMTDETGDITFNGYVQNYFSNIKGNAFVPMSFTINKDAEMADGFKMIFEDVEDEKVMELGVVVDFINGSQQVSITEDMLTDKQRKMIAMKMTTFEKIKRELGDTVRGDRVTKTELKELMRGYSNGSESTAFEISDLIRKPVKQEEDVNIFDEDDI